MAQDSRTDLLMTLTETDSAMFTNLKQQQFMICDREVFFNSGR